MPSRHFAELSIDPSQLPAFFDHHFPGATDLIAEKKLISSFNENPHLPLISLKCKPYHYNSSGVIIGDAAHAMVPFYGQGMNAGMEDVRVLFSILDKHNTQANEGTLDDGSVSIKETASVKRAKALAEYSATRAPDAYAINDLALQNYVEMRASVLSRRYRLRKFLEEFASVHLPSLGWHTRYFRVSFSNEPYSEVVRSSEHQGKVLVRSLVALFVSPFMLMTAWQAYRYKRSIVAVYKGLSTLSSTVPG